METKVCKICTVEKQLSEYYFRNDSKTYRPECKECHLKQKKKYNKENSEYRKQYMNEYRQKNPTKYNEWRSENIERVLDGRKKILINTESIKGKVRKRDWILTPSID